MTSNTKSDPLPRPASHTSPPVPSLFTESRWLSAAGFIFFFSRTAPYRQFLAVTERTEIHTDGTFNDRTGVGGRAAVIARFSAGRQEATSSYEMELRAIVEAAKMAEGPCTIVSDHEGIVSVVQRGMTPRVCRAVWEELYAATEGKDVNFAWRKRDQSLGSRLANQLARDAARAR